LDLFELSLAFSLFLSLSLSPGFLQSKQSILIGFDGRWIGLSAASRVGEDRRGTWQDLWEIQWKTGEWIPLKPGCSIRTLLKD